MSLTQVIQKLSVTAIILVVFMVQALANQGTTCTAIPHTNDITVNGTTNPSSPRNVNLQNRDVNTSTVLKVSGAGFHIWNVPNETTIRGVIVESNVTLTLGSSSNADRPSFSIEGTSTAKGQILVRRGGTLNLAWISNLSNVVVCVEDGGTINFDSRGTNNQPRNLFSFEDVDFVLNGANATLNFDNANIKVEGNVTFTGVTGPIPCDPVTGSPITNQSTTNITWSSSTTGICAFGLGIGLPVEFIYFRGALDINNRLVQLTWATAKEWENSHFEIERAMDQINNFETIGEKAGVGYSDETVNYAFEDTKLPLAGGMAYYRLKQVDFDGTYAYSEVIAVRLPASTNISNVWKAFPNPNKGGERFNLELVNRGAYNNEEVIVKLVSPVGKQQVFTGKDLRVISENITQSFQKSTNGLYIVEVSWGTQKEQIKVMKN